MMSSFTHFLASHTAGLEHVGWNIIKIILLFIATKIVMALLTRVLRRLLLLHGRMDERRRKTLESLFVNVVKYTIYFVLVLTILPLFGVHIEALLAGAGVAGIAIAFGAQSLLKDFFNGFFILFEDQFGVGDTVTINSITGTVYSVGLRITVIKIWTGEMVYIPNGDITQATNYSKQNSIAVIDINIGHKTPPEEAIPIIEQVMQTLEKEQENIVGNASVVGVQALNDSSYTLRATAECNPCTHWGIVRLAQQQIRAEFMKHGVDLPIQKIVYTHDTMTDNQES